MSNLSAGVQILIAQLKENPEQFFGEIHADPRYTAEKPKFISWKQVIEDELVSVDYHNERLTKRLPYTWFMSEDEKAALADAYLEAKRQRFDAEIIYLMNARPEPDRARIYPQVVPPFVQNLTTGPHPSAYNTLATANKNCV